MLPFKKCSLLEWESQSHITHTLSLLIVLKLNFFKIYDIKTILNPYSFDTQRVQIAKNTF